MRRRSTLPPETVHWHIETLAWMIRTFGPPHLPRVPSMLKRYEPLSQCAHRPDDDARTPEDWAEDTFARLIEDTRMEDWPLACRPSPPSSTPSEESGISSVPLSNWHPDAPGTFHVNVKGDPIVVYTTEALASEGVFALSVTLQLAAMRLASAPSLPDYLPQRHAHLLAAMAIYGSHGLDLLAMAETLTGHFVQAGLLGRGEVATFEAELEFATLLAMRVRGLTPEQIVASYGPVLDKGFRKRIWDIVQDIDAFAPEVKLLRHLCQGQRCDDLAGTGHLIATSGR